MRYIILLSILAFSSCHPSVSQKGQYGLFLTSAEAIHWTTGANGHEGVTYELKIENPDKIEVAILSFWVGGKLKNINTNTSSNNFVISLTESKNSNADELESAENPTKKDAAGVLKYRIGDAEYYWLIDEFSTQEPSHNHLPE